MKINDNKKKKNLARNWLCVRFCKAGRTGDVVHRQQLMSKKGKKLKKGDKVLVGWRESPGAKLVPWEAHIVDMASSRKKVEKVLNNCLSRNRWFTDTELEDEEERQQQNKVGTF